MELLYVFRPLWRMRLPVLAGVLASMAVFVGLHGLHPVKPTVGVAWTRVALDTPTSQLVDTAPDGADSLKWRAAALMHELATNQTQAELARRLGIPRDHVTVVDKYFNVPQVPASMPIRAAQAASLAVSPYVLNVEMPDLTLPVITVEADAPDIPSAQRLAAAAVAVMESRASRGGTYTSLIRTAGSRHLQPFIVEPVATVQTKVMSKIKPPIKAAGASMLLLFGWTCAAVLVPGLRRRRRMAAALA